MELRCRESNKRFGDLDPASLALWFKCRTCSTRDRDVLHPYPLVHLLQAIASGADVVFPDESICTEGACDTMETGTSDHP